jgi:hypothetical protein
MGCVSHFTFATDAKSGKWRYGPFGNYVGLAFEISYTFTRGAI